MKNKRSVSVLSVLFAAAALFSQDVPPESSVTAPDSVVQELSILTSLHNYDLNPHTASYTTEAELLTGLYEGLFSPDPVSLEPQYALATDYRLSRDKLRWTFTLRENAKFSDGTPITASVIRDSWLALLAEKNAPYASLFDIVKGAKAYRTGTGSRDDVGITASDDKTLTVRLAEPAGHLPRLLCLNAFAAVSGKPDVYSGPFCCVIDTQGGFEFVKNPEYWDAANVKLEKIDIYQSDDIEENAFSFNTGAIDWISSSADVKKLLDKNAAQVTAEFATEYLFFKQHGGVWDNAELRNALLEAVPWDKLREGAFVPAPTFVYPLNNYPQVEGFSYSDAEEAANLMAEARKNAEIPADKILVLNFVITDTEYMAKQAQILCDAWKPLGVDVVVEKIASDKYLSSIDTSDGDLFSYTWIGDFADPLAFLELFRGDSTLNVAGWKNAEYDKLLSDAALYQDAEHFKLLAKAEQLLLDSGMVLPVSHPVSLNIIDLSTVGGWAANSFDIHPLKYLFKKSKDVKIPNLVMFTR